MGYAEESQNCARIAVCDVGGFLQDKEKTPPAFGQRRSFCYLSTTAK